MSEPSVNRGDTVTRGDKTGLYVGTTDRGLVWIAWEPESFARMCAAFDAAIRRRQERHNENAGRD